VRRQGSGGDEALRRLLLGALCALLLVACGLPLGRRVHPASVSPPTTSAVAQAAAPLALTVVPAEGQAGMPFQLRVTGLLPADVVTFAIAAQGGHPYIGPPHSPVPGGTVTAVYESSATDALGLYVVLAHTAGGRSVYATFHLERPTTPVSS
jgi:hypothetical protein